MTIDVSCSQCGRTYSVPDELAGKRTQCKCGARLAVPSARATAAGYGRPKARRQRDEERLRHSHLPTGQQLFQQNPHALRYEPVEVSPDDELDFQLETGDNESQESQPAREAPPQQARPAQAHERIGKSDILEQEQSPPREPINLRPLFWILGICLVVGGTVFLVSLLLVDDWRDLFGSAGDGLSRADLSILLVNVRVAKVLALDDHQFRKLARRREEFHQDVRQEVMQAAGFDPELPLDEQQFREVSDERVKEIWDRKLLEHAEEVRSLLTRKQRKDLKSRYESGELQHPDQRPRLDFSTMRNMQQLREQARQAQSQGEEKE